MNRRLIATVVALLLGGSLEASLWAAPAATPVIQAVGTATPAASKTAKNPTTKVKSTSVKYSGIKPSKAERMKSIQDQINAIHANLLKKVQAQGTPAPSLK